MSDEELPGGPRSAIFLDRDGTLITELGYLADPAALEMVPRAAEAVARLQGAGFLIVLVTNQSGVARGLFSEADLRRIHARLGEQLAEAGATIDLIAYCPHHPDIGEPPYRRSCSCRKPQPGLILQAAAELRIDLATSWVVGDSLRDLEAGQRAGVPGLVLVRTGKGAATLEALGEVGAEGLLVADDLDAAASMIVARAGRGRPAEPQGR